MSIVPQRPIVQKPEKVDDPEEYLAEVRSLPCCICEAFDMVQLSPTTAHHWTMGRGGNRKTPNREAIPLCDGHHQGKFDTSKIALHREPETWREAYGLDSDWTAQTQARTNQMKGH